MISIPLSPASLKYRMVFLTDANLSRLSRKHTCAQPFYCSLDFVRDNQGELIPEETFTHSHLSSSSIIPYLLPPSIMIHGSVQFTCLTVFLHNLSQISKFSLVYLLAWHPPLHTTYVSSPNHSSFRNTCPYH